jgi:bacteriorhodopsin
VSLGRAARLLTIAAATVVVTAAPAGATGTVLANDKYKWFYWLSFIFAIMIILGLVNLSVGYIRKVLLPKYRGRRVE